MLVFNNKYSGYMQQAFGKQVRFKIIWKKIAILKVV